MQPFSMENFKNSDEAFYTPVWVEIDASYGNCILMEIETVVSDSIL